MNGPLEARRIHSGHLRLIVVSGLFSCACSKFALPAEEPLWDTNGKLSHRERLFCPIDERRHPQKSDLSDGLRCMQNGVAIAADTVDVVSGCGQTIKSPLVKFVDLHLKCKAGFVESFEWGEIVESLSWSIVEPVRHVCKGVV